MTVLRKTWFKFLSKNADFKLSSWRDCYFLPQSTSSMRKFHPVGKVKGWGYSNKNPSSLWNNDLKDTQFCVKAAWILFSIYELCNWQFHWQAFNTCTFYFLCVCCRERLIHLLALRPFKKLELYDRLNKGKQQQP